MNYYMATALVSTIGGPLLGFLVYKWRTRVDIDAKRENADIDAKQAPLTILREELAKREAELAEVRKNDHEERKQLIETLTSINKNMDTMGNSQEKIANTLDGYGLRLVAIEAHLNVQPPRVP